MQGDIEQAEGGGGRRICGKKSRDNQVPLLIHTGNPYVNRLTKTQNLLT